MDYDQMMEQARKTAEANAAALAEYDRRRAVAPSAPPTPAAQAAPAAVPVPVEPPAGPPAPQPSEAAPERPAVPEAAPLVPDFEPDMEKFTQKLWQARANATVPEFQKAKGRMRPMMTVEDAIVEAAREAGVDADSYEKGLRRYQYPLEHAVEVADTRGRPAPKEFVDEIRALGGLTKIPTFQKAREEWGSKPKVMADIPLVYDEGVIAEREVSKQGEVGQLVASVLINEVLDNPDRAHWVDYLDGRAVVNEDTIADMADSALKRQGITSTSDSYRKRFHKEYEAAQDLAIALKTANMHSGMLRFNLGRLLDSRKPVQELIREGDEAWEAGEYGEWLKRRAGVAYESFTPTVEILGVGRDNKTLVLREESRTEYLMNMIDVPQAALVGMIRGKIQRAQQGDFMPHGPDLDPMFEGIASRNSFVGLGSELGYDLGGQWGSVAGTILGFPAAVITPDMTLGLAGALKYGAKAFRSGATALGFGRAAAHARMAGRLENAAELFADGAHAEANAAESAIRATGEAQGRDGEGKIISTVLGINDAAAARAVAKTDDVELIVNGNYKPQYISPDEEFYKLHDFAHYSEAKRANPVGEANVDQAARVSIKRSFDFDGKQARIDDMRARAGDIALNGRTVGKRIKGRLKDKLIKHLMDSGLTEEKANEELAKALDAVPEKFVGEDIDAVVKVFDDVLSRNVDAAEIQKAQKLRVELNAKMDVTEKAREAAQAATDKVRGAIERAWNIDSPALLPEMTKAERAAAKAKIKAAKAELKAIKAEVKELEKAERAAKAVLGRAERSEALVRTKLQAADAAAAGPMMRNIEAGQIRDEAEAIVRRFVQEARSGGIAKDLAVAEEAVAAQKRAHIIALEMTAAQLRGDQRIVVQGIEGVNNKGQAVRKTNPDPRTGKGRYTTLMDQISKMANLPEAQQRMSVYEAAAEILSTKNSTSFEVDGVMRPLTPANIKAAVDAGQSVKLPKKLFDQGTLTAQNRGRLQDLLDQTDLVEAAAVAPKIPWRRLADSLETNRLTEFLDAVVNPSAGRSDTTAAGLKAFVHTALFGGAPYEDLTRVPAAMKPMYQKAVRPIEGSVGDAAQLLYEGGNDNTNFYRYIDGAAGVALKTGMPLPNAGYVDAVGVVKAALKAKIDSMEPAAAEALMTVLNSSKVGEDISMDIARKLDIEDALTEAIDVLYGPAKSATAAEVAAKEGKVSDGALGSTFMTQLRLVTNGVETRPPVGGRDLRVIRAVLESDDTAEAGARAKFVADEINATFTRSKVAGERALMVMLSNAAAAKSMDDLVQAGGVFTAKQRALYGNMIGGVQIPEGELDMAQDMLNKVGLAAKLTTVTHNGQKMHIPEGALRLLDSAIARGMDPKVASLLGLGNLSHVSSSVFNELVRRNKMMMVRGQFISKPKFFTMATMDIFKLTFQHAGFDAAIRATTRAIAQNITTSPGVANFIAIANWPLQKWRASRGLPEVVNAQEGVRRALQDLGDATTNKLFQAARYDLRVNKLLQGADDVLELRTGDYTYADLLRIFNEEGVFATFGTHMLQDQLAFMLFNRRFGELADVDPRDLKLSAEAAADLGPEVAARLLHEARKGVDSVARVINEMADSFDMRSRAGVAFAMIEAGMSPRAAARSTAIMHYDFAGSMSSADRAFMLNVFFPFWAFQKNANRQWLDLITTPEGAYRLGISRRFRGAGVDVIQNAIDMATSDPYGVQPELMSDEQRNFYFTCREALERKYGGYTSVPESVRAGFRSFIAGGIGDRPVMHEGQMYRINDSRDTSWVARQARLMDLAAATGGAPGDVPTPAYYNNPSVIKFGANLSSTEQRKQAEKAETVIAQMLLLPESTEMATVNHLSVYAVGMSNIVQWGVGLAAETGINAFRDEGEKVNVGLGGSRKEIIQEQFGEALDVTRAPLLGATANKLLGVTSEAGERKRRLSNALGFVLSVHAPGLVDVQLPMVSGNEARYRIDESTFSLLSAVPLFGGLLNDVDRMLKTFETTGRMPKALGSGSASDAAAAILAGGMAQLGMPVTEIKANAAASQAERRFSRHSTTLPK